jgi:putative addiction module component (TIGR02574 family)
MQTVNEFNTMIPDLPLSERIAIRNQLDESIDASLTLQLAAMEQADFAMMEQRLDDYETGLVKGATWDEVEYRIRQSLKL